MACGLPQALEISWPLCLQKFSLFFFFSWDSCYSWPLKTWIWAAWIHLSVDLFQYMHTVVLNLQLVNLWIQNWECGGQRLRFCKIFNCVGVSTLNSVVQRSTVPVYGSVFLTVLRGYAYVFFWISVWVISIPYVQVLSFFPRLCGIYWRTNWKQPPSLFCFWFPEFKFYFIF